MIPEGVTTLIHQVVMLEETQPAIEQLEGVKPNEKHGAVTPVRAKAGRQDFACMVDMSKHAGKLYEGAMHGGTDDPQFVNCPMCKETAAYKEKMAEHERHTRADKGLFAGILNKQGNSAVPGGAEGAGGRPSVPEPVPAPGDFGEMLPIITDQATGTVAGQ